ncbi:hypothetical protein B566_EDAN010412 [Ephemera danica]|nr:hypothetical protein B566_EDAN010412 [Ephemera danica]
MRREDMSRRWAEAIGRQDWIPTKNSFVCSQHFTSNDYQIRPGKHKHFLREDAIPSVFPPSMPPRRRGLCFKPVTVSPAQPPLHRKLPFILPSHLEIKSCSPSPVSSSTPPYDPAVDLLPATLPSGVSITPLKRTHQKSSSPLFPQYDTFSNGNNPYKRVKNVIPKDLPVIHPSNNTSVFLTGGKPSKPLPSLTPLYPKLDQFDPREDQNGDEEPVVDVTQFLSISLQAEEEQYSHRPQLSNHNSVSDTTTSEILRKKYLYMQKELQKRDMTIKSLQHQMREMRKKMDSISVKKILNDSFKGLTYDILENYLNNVSLDSCEKSYSGNVKEFSMKLLELSPDAYALVRSQFDLPHPANVSHWLRSANEAEEEEHYKDSPEGVSSLHEDSEEHFEEEAVDIKEEVGDAEEPAVEAQPSKSQSESLHSVAETLKAEDVNVVMETEEAC